MKRAKYSCGMAWKDGRMNTPDTKLIAAKTMTNVTD